MRRQVQSDKSIRRERAHRALDAQKTCYTGPVGGRKAPRYDRFVIELDAIDRHIVDVLRENGRESSAAIAKLVNLSPAAVRRRIARLEESGVITGYAAMINQDLVGTGIEAYVELSFAGDADLHAILEQAITRREVHEAMMIAGTSDALVRLRVGSLAELRGVVMDLRTSGATSSKTHIVIGRWRHGAAPQPPSQRASP